MRVYADNSATTPVSELVLKAMYTCMKNVWGNPSSLHSCGQTAAQLLQESREMAAGCLNAEPDEITFTSGGTESVNQALVTGAAIGLKKNKKHIISSMFEHHAVLHTLNKLEKQGFEITLLPVYENGIVRPGDLADAIREDTVLASVMYVNNEVGTIQPVRELAEVCHERGVLFHTDSVQAAGHVPIDVKEQKMDMLSISAHKFHGPKGVGALFVRKGIPVAPILEGGGQEKGKRSGTENVPGIMGMAVALREMQTGMQEREARVLALRERLRKGLAAIPATRVNGDLIQRVAGNLNMVFEGIEGESILLMLNDEGIAASSGSACTSSSLEPSHVLLALGVPHEIAHGSIRFSLSGYNTQEEIDHIIKVMPGIVAKLRQMSPVWQEMQR